MNSLDESFPAFSPKAKKTLTILAVLLACPSSRAFPYAYAHSGKDSWKNVKGLTAAGTAPDSTLFQNTTGFSFNSGHENALETKINPNV